MIEKPIAFYDAVRRQNYFQWPKGKYFIYQEPIYDRTKEYIEALEAENAKLRKYVNAMAIQSYKGKIFDCGYCPFHNQCYNDEPKEHQGRGCQWWLWARELGIEVD